MVLYVGHEARERFACETIADQIRSLVAGNGLHGAHLATLGLDSGSNIALGYASVR